MRTSTPYSSGRLLGIDMRLLSYTRFNLQCSSKPAACWVSEMQLCPPASIVQLCTVDFADGHGTHKSRFWKCHLLYSVLRFYLHSPRVRHVVRNEAVMKLGTVREGHQVLVCIWSRCPSRSPTKIDCRKVGTLILSSLLEDLVKLNRLTGLSQS